MGRRKKSNLHNNENERGRSAAGVGQKEPRRRKSSSTHTTKFSNYIFKVLKQVHPQLSMTNKAMKVMDDFMHDIYTRLVAEAAGLVKLTRRSTLSASEFQTATRLILPGELAKHAISDGTKAVQNFLQSRNDDAKRNTARARETIDASTSLNSANVQEPVEIEIFGTVPKPSILNGSRDIPMSHSDLEEYMEEDIEEDIEETEDIDNDADSIPRQALFPLRSTPTLESTVKQPEKQNSNTVKSSVNLDITPINSSIDESVLETGNKSPVRNNRSGENIAEPSTLHRLIGRPATPLTPPAESDTSVTSSVTLDMQSKGDSSNNGSRDVEPEAETVRLESSQSSEEVGSNPVVTVHVEVTRHGNPTVISDVTVGCEKRARPDSSDTQSENNKQLSSSSTSAGESNESVPEDSQISLIADMEEVPVASSADSSTSTETSETCQQTTVTVVTTKTTFVHERKEQITEWLSENESFN